VILLEDTSLANLRSDMWNRNPNITAAGGKPEGGFGAIDVITLRGTFNWLKFICKHADYQKSLIAPQPMPLPSLGDSQIQCPC
jgi:hypothetical protein